MSSFDHEEPVRRCSSHAFTKDSGGREFSLESQAEMSERSEPDKSVIPKNRVIKVEVGEIVVFIIIDYTGSMGGDSCILRDKEALLWDQLRNYLGSLLVCMGGVGDAHGDQYPLQLAGLARGGAIKDELLKTFVEGKGGSGCRESYELMAYYLLNNVEVSEPKKSFVFFFADEVFYNEVSVSQVRKFIGGEAKAIDSVEVFRKLSEKFNVYLIHRRYADSDTDTAIVDLWSVALGDDHVLRLQTSNAVVDYLLGVVALHSGRTLAQYDEDMKKRGQTEERRTEVRLALEGLSKILVPEQVRAPAAEEEGTNDRSSPGQRL
jgi:hypothetical protein